jgi:hypothetical protein
LAAAKIVLTGPTSSPLACLSTMKAGLKQAAGLPRI